MSLILKRHGLIKEGMIKCEFVLEFVNLLITLYQIIATDNFVSTLYYYNIIISVICIPGRSGKLEDIFFRKKSFTCDMGID